jgi:hypothetical protein
MREYQILRDHIRRVREVAGYQLFRDGRMISVAMPSGEGMKSTYLLAIALSGISQSDDRR